jgi:SpoVK/Ycf46/Vps4 family AAA+-type ATPase
MRCKPSSDFLYDDDFDDDTHEKNTQEKPLNKTQLKSMTLLDKLEHLIELTKSCGLDNTFFKIHKLLIESVANELVITPVQTVLLCPFISMPGRSLDDSDLQHYFQCTSITIMRHWDELTGLRRRRYIRNSGGFNRGNMCLTEKARLALCKNQPLPVINITGLSAADFMSHFRSLVVDNEKNREMDAEELLQETMELIRANQHLEIAQAINNLQVDDEAKMVILTYCKTLVKDKQDGIPLNYFDDLIEDYYEFKEAILNGKHPFITEGLLEHRKVDDFFSRDVFALTEKARKLLLKEYDVPKREIVAETPNSDVIRSKDIKPKPMYYCDEDEGQINTLFSLLEDKKLTSIRKRLEKANLRKGFNCLFYGAPGTGKTETALQLARATGRDIMQVDISSIRDKWYGETEKIVKSIFENYAQLVKRSPKIPILLINEADAILSVRTSIGGSNPSIDKTENAIQNILLEAMENIDGIMIATTNLTCNLDSAFDRRFLYKVEFHQPSVEAKTHIWKVFLPDLNTADARWLARSFDFSGGQIENIARKVMVDHLLFGDTPDLARIEEICIKEQISGRTGGNRRPIGFNS